MATIKQRLAFKEVVNGSTLTKAMKVAGFSESTSKRTNKLTHTKGWKELTDKYLSDAELTKKHHEQLNSSKLAKLYFDIDDDDEMIEKVCKKLGVELLYVKVNKDKTGKTANVKAPDFFFRDLALDKGYKIKGKYHDDSNSNKTMVLVVTGESAARYGVKSNQEPGPSST